jgi:1,4-alpha-glucan branching enzyme
MLYHHHGLEKAFTSYDDYFKAVNQDALAYLTIANKLIHQFNPNALTIAEEMSGMPGLCSDFNNNGLGFDYRLSMGIPDYWIKIIKEQTDEQWQVSRLLSELSNHRPEEKTISYAESHDQALVGDKTLIFRLADSNMYSGMHIDHQDLVIDRAIALHKIIRLLTAGANQGGYLNFMGNEYGHPEWIDFPREGNNWSYKYAKRQWNLTDDPNLKYQWLGLFDQAMISLLNKHTKDMSEPISWTTVNDGDHVLCFMRGNLMFVFNLSPNNSYEHYGIYAPHGQYKVVLSSDDDVFGGYNRIDKNYTYNTDTSERALKLYIPARTGFVLKANKY